MANLRITLSCFGAQIWKRLILNTNERVHPVQTLEYVNIRSGCGRWLLLLLVMYRAASI